MKQAIINILNAISERIRPITYEFELVKDVKLVDENDITIGTKLVYFCNKTGKSKIIEI